MGAKKAEVIQFNALSREKWKSRICEAWQKQLVDIFEVGSLLEAAKAELAHGEWKIMVKEELPFTRMTAHMLIAIGKDDKLRNVNHGLHLPAHWRTLFELTKLTDEQFERAIETKQIHQKMKRSDVAELRGVSSKKQKPPSSIKPPIGAGDRCTMKIRSLVLYAIDEIPQSEWMTFVAGLHDEIQDIERVIKEKMK